MSKFSGVARSDVSGWKLLLNNNKIFPLPPPPILLGSAALFSIRFYTIFRKNIKKKIFRTKQDREDDVSENDGMK